MNVLEVYGDRAGGKSELVKALVLGSTMLARLRHEIQHEVVAVVLFVDRKARDHFQQSIPPQPGRSALLITEQEFLGRGAKLQGQRPELVVVEDARRFPSEILDEITRTSRALGVKSLVFVADTPPWRWWRE